MRPRSKLLAVGAVLLAGVVGAWSFRHGVPDPAEPSQQAQGLERRASQAAAPAGQNGHLLGRIEPLAADVDEDPDRTEPVQPLPNVGSSLDESRFVSSGSIRETSQFATPPTPAAEMPDDSPWTAVGAPRSAGPVGSVAAGFSGNPVSPIVTGRRPRASHTRHTVSDGDTLSSLAQNYLGDGGRWAEVFELNRDLLRDPDILPIGARIKIPEAGSPPAAPVVAQRGPITSLASDRSVSTYAPPPVGSVTTLAPLVPISAGAYRSAREQARGATYRVQPRDTLVSIARHFYGDDRRYQEIYEANRTRIPDPNDLPVGVVLTIP